MGTAPVVANAADDIAAEIATPTPDQPPAPDAATPIAPSAIPAAGAPVVPPGYPPYPQGFAPYPPGYAPYPPYPAIPPYPPQPAPIPPRRGYGKLVAGILAGVLLLCALCAGGLVWVTGLRSSAHVGTATKTPSGTPTATLVEVTALHDDFSSSTSGWGNDGAHCFYRDGTYHVAGGYICFAPTPDLSDEVITADVKQEAGSTRWFYGIVMRFSSEGYYNAFFIDGNGEWMFSRNVNSKRTDIVPYRYTSALRKGLNVTNTLKVLAVGSHFEFFINGVKVGEADDTVSAGNNCGIEGNSGGGVVVGVSQFTLAWLR